MTTTFPSNQAPDHLVDRAGDAGPGRASEPPEVEAQFVAPRVAVDIEGLRRELLAIAVAWLGADHAGPAAELIGGARAGVADFVAVIAAVGEQPSPGHEPAVCRAMAREMHYRAAQVLCGV